MGLLTGRRREVPRVDGQLGEVGRQHLRAAPLDPRQCHGSFEHGIVAPRICGVRARCCPRVGPVVVGRVGLGHGEGIFVVAERGDAVEYADEVAEHRAHVHLGARRRGGELVGPDAGDDGPAGGDGTVEDRPGVDEVVRGRAGRCGHAVIVPTQTGHVMTGLM